MDAADIRDRLGDWIDHERPLYQALAERLAELSESGELPTGVRLPAERQLASVLAVSRGTVVRAYEWLRERDLVHTRHGSGTVVGDASTPAPSPREAKVASILPGNTILAGVVERPGEVIDLRGAYWVGREDLPTDAFEEAWQDVDVLLEGHGYSPLGLPELREEIAAHLTSRGLETTAEQVLPTTGAMQAISLAAQLRVGAGDLVLTEALTYPGALDALRMADGHLVGVAMSQHGVDVGELRSLMTRRRPRLVYLVPSFNNPTGTVMPAPARKLLVDVLAEVDTTIIDDLTMSEMWLEQAPPPPLAAGQPPEIANKILTVGSLSKSIWGGLRVGWIRGHEPVIQRLARLKAATDLSSSVINHALGLRLLERADEEIFPARRAELRRRFDNAEAALAEHLPDWSWSRPAGGLALWVDLGWGCALEFGPYAAREGVGIAPGNVYAADGGARHHLRLPVGQHPQITAEGIRRLGRAWDAYRADAEPRTDSMTAVI